MVAGCASLAVLPTAGAQRPLECKSAGALVRIGELPEGSGITASRTTPGRLWAHNDSGEPVLLALDGEGRVTGRLTLPGARVDDWEAIAAGRCPSGSCLYVADIGDNGAARAQITLYRIPEPGALSGPAPQVEAFHATYPDGAHDAEALLIDPDGRVHIVTKGETGPIALYRFPGELRADGTMRLERVGAPRAHASAGKERITDGAVSPDGRLIALRSVDALTFYRAIELFAGKWREVGRVPVTTLGEPQGEGVTFGTGSSMYLIGEGGGGRQPGTFARLACALDH